MDEGMNRAGESPERGVKNLFNTIGGIRGLNEVKEKLKEEGDEEFLGSGEDFLTDSIDNFLKEEPTNIKEYNDKLKELESDYDSYQVKTLRGKNYVQDQLFDSSKKKKQKKKDEKRKRKKERKERRKMEKSELMDEIDGLKKQLGVANKMNLEMDKKYKEQQELVQQMKENSSKGNECCNIL